MSPVKYELDFISQKTPFFIVTSVKTSSLTQYVLFYLTIGIRIVLHEISFTTQNISSVKLAMHM
jgi:hypothetical protein